MTADKRTPLYDEHLGAGAKIAPFAGFLMPIEYTGIIAEHSAVRSSVGMFDLSHMGEIVVRGERALEAVDGLVTNTVHDLEVWQARYTPMCLDGGGIIDDLIVYRYPDRLMLVVNASNTAKDYEWVRQHVEGAVVSDESDSIALIAIQGPTAPSLVQSLTETNLDEIAYYHFALGEVAGVSCTISRTGYTGEDGVELYVEAGDAVRLWRALLEAPADPTPDLVGLGARDTLRLEAGLALYGNDITEQTTPLEAGLGWTVKFDDRRFVGREALAEQKSEGVQRRLVAFAMNDRGIPRPHYSVLIQGRESGEVTSGTFSPTFGEGIGLAYVPAESARVGTELEIDIRGRTHAASIVSRPMYRRSTAAPRS